MDFEVMKAYLPRFWDALLLTLRIGWQGVALALALGVACAVAVHWKFPCCGRSSAGTLSCSAIRLCWCSCFPVLCAAENRRPHFGGDLRQAGTGTAGRRVYGRNLPQRAGKHSHYPDGKRPELRSAPGAGVRLHHSPAGGDIQRPRIARESDFLLKETSVFSTISLMDLMFTAKDLIGMYAKTIECLTLLVIFYLIMLLPVSILGSWLERRLRYAEFGN